jgi:predicted nucleic acid-binding protein
VTALDTSVVVAAFATWHELHDAAAREVTPSAVVPAHVVAETYAVLTRMPAPFRLDGDVVADYLRRQWHDRIIAPDAALHGRLASKAASREIMGGSVYDALVGLTAAKHREQLVSMDVRAERTYRALGIEYRLIGLD